MKSAYLLLITMKKVVHGLSHARMLIFGIFYSCSLFCYSRSTSVFITKEIDVPSKALPSSIIKSTIHKSNDSPDGTFNGLNIYHVNSSPKTTIHCVGENFDNQRSWLFRSCEFKTLCYDLDQRDIVMYIDPPDDIPETWWSSTQVHPTRATVAGGSQPKTWFLKPPQSSSGPITPIGQFRPRVGNPPSNYYRFNATLLPFYRHPTSYRNPGHLLWDDFLSIYTLLDIYDRVDDRLFLAQMRRAKTETFSEPIPPFDIIEKFLPLMGNYGYNLDIFQDYDLQIEHPKFKNDETERVICADHGLLGSGMFSDHGESRWHGQWKSDRVLPHNIGRGGLFRRYRSFLMKNVGISSQQRTIQRKPYRIVVSISSSTKADRANVSFTSQIQALSQLEPRVEIQAVQMSKLSLIEQIELTSTAAFYVSMTGGGTATAMFLPKGAHLILYYVPSRYLDWDFWNNFPHIHTHWLPRSRKDRGENTALDIERFLELVTRELNILEQEG
jgi:Glycosyltransferase 61